jgi:RHS repeat-associated protein
VNTQDFDLQQITNLSGVNPVSQFVYGTDVPTHRITSWSQQSGAQTPSVSTLSYDAADQLSSVSVAQGAVTTGSYGYSYDTASNRLTAQIGSVSTTSIYNALNELTSDNSAAAGTISYQWDGEKRLSAVNVGNQSTQFSYDGRGRCIGILELVNGSEVSNRLFVWCGNELSEERTSTNAVTKRYFPQGMQLATGATAGLYYYTRDHLGSIREMCDATGTIRAAYAYDPFGQQTQVSGDLVADFGFAGMFWSPEASLNLTVFRAYNSVTGRWLSRDSLPGSEIQEGPNLFGYVQNNPVNLTERRGLWTSLWPSSRAVSPVVTNEK